MQQVEDLTIRAQLRQRQNKPSEAISLFEKALELRIQLFGPDSQHVRKACNELSDILNGEALKHLQKDEHDIALGMLRKAEILAGPEDLVAAVTYNNLACYYRRKGKFRTALSYLQQALHIEKRAEVVVNPAGTRLNLCAVLSQLGRHAEALEHAEAGVILLQEELVQHQLNRGEVDGESTEDGEGSEAEVTTEMVNKLAVLAICYHNIGVEEEYLGRPDRSIDAYSKGLEIAKCYLSPDNGIYKTLHESYAAATKERKEAKARGASGHDAAPQSKGAQARGASVHGGAYDALARHKTQQQRLHSASSASSQSRGMGASQSRGMGASQSRGMGASATAATMTRTTTGSKARGSGHGFGATNASLTRGAGGGVGAMPDPYQTYVANGISRRSSAPAVRPGSSRPASAAAVRRPASAAVFTMSRSGNVAGSRAGGSWQVSGGALGEGGRRRPASALASLE